MQPDPCPTPFNMAAYVLAHAGVQPDKLAMAIIGADEAESWTYGALEAAVRGTASGLLGAGLLPGDRVLLRLGNSVDFPIAYLGAIAAGMVPVPTSSQLTVPELATVTDQIAPALALQDPDLPAPKSVRRAELGTLRGWRALPPTPYHMGDPERPGYIVFTSGTSGRARAVVHAHRAIWARRMMHEGWYGLRAEDRLLHAGAFNWTYTLGTGLMDPWSVGATALIPADGTPLEALPELLRQHDATLFAAAPGVYRKLLNARTMLNLPSLRHGLSAGEKLSETLSQRWAEATCTQVYEAYGMSEASTFISSSPTSPCPPTALGRPQKGRRVAIRKDGAEQPPGTPGTIALHRSDPGLMLGYLGAEAETQARFSGDWFLTGDLGAMDASGLITYLGRDDDMMNAGGYRVSPLEVEVALSAIPGLDQIAVTDIEVAEDARVIMAFYTAPAPLKTATLEAFAQARLAGYKRPRAYHHVATLPLNPNGKLQRRALRPIYEALHGQT
ncbi:acyl--CoA ligase [Roseovarius sp. LXJ103]|uniref:class I adenylate-forming enzyme family protein n=1 Tax=Roseovarius carneus TaxID=2853164 RepID=UPI000D618CA4|nr:class I adenylate-forming enzyme family protein [Roseovarius carneus]MBZ8119383.1 acyl--CoA ligase [Roseovarius carneus]PWE34970.1 benzoate--CoA ligase [Pelagicola sp. LXJ1103]